MFASTRVKRKQPVKAVRQQALFIPAELIKELSTHRLKKEKKQKTDQILSPHRTAVKGNSGAGSPPGMSTPKKHSEMKGDMEICSDTAVSEQTRQHNRTPPALWQPRLRGALPARLRLCLRTAVGAHTHANSHRCSHFNRMNMFTNTPAAQHRIPWRFTIDSHCVLTRPTIYSPTLFIISPGRRWCCCFHKADGFWVFQTWIRLLSSALFFLQENALKLWLCGFLFYYYYYYYYYL